MVKDLGLHTIHVFPKLDLKSPLERPPACTARAPQRGSVH